MFQRHLSRLASLPVAILLLQAKYDEFSYFRDYKNFVDDSVLHSPVRAEFLGCDIADAAWDTTFGSFSEGTARRMELLETKIRQLVEERLGSVTTFPPTITAAPEQVEHVSQDIVDMLGDLELFQI